MKIVHIETGRHFYGGARQVGYLLDALAEFDFENLLVCHSSNPLAETNSAQTVSWPMRGDLDILLYRRLIDLIRRQQPDLVHVHSRRGGDLFGGRAARAAGVPAVLTRRVDSHEPRFWLRLKCSPYRRIVAISSAVEKQLANAGVEPSRLACVHSAVDTALFRPDTEARSKLVARYGLPSDAIVLGSAAQFIERKGQGLLLQLLRALIAEEPRVRLLLYGQGPRRARIERQAKRYGLAGHAIFPGFVSDWPALVPGLDLFLHPARREGLGAVVLEAMSAGVPVIASRAGGIVDVIETDVDGMLVAGESIAAWRDAVGGLLSDSIERIRLAASARRKVEERFTIERMSERYAELYREILHDDRP